MQFQGINLSCYQGRRYLFRNLNFSLQAGELLLIKGHNGSGKTSLLRILTGLVLPAKGQIKFEHSISYLGHKNSLKMWLTPFENMSYLYALSSKKELPLQQMDRLASKLDLAGHLHRPCRLLSAGQCRKVALMAVILNAKKLWILDEPFTALDSDSVKCFKEHFAQHLSQGGMIILSSHAGVEEFTHQVIDLTKQKIPC
jgi:heme exporter protein A